MLAAYAPLEVVVESGTHTHSLGLAKVRVIESAKLCRDMNNRRPARNKNGPVLRVFPSSGPERNGESAYARRQSGAPSGPNPLNSTLPRRQRRGPRGSKMQKQQLNGPTFSKPEPSNDRPLMNSNLSSLNGMPAAAPKPSVEGVPTLAPVFSKAHAKRPLTEGDQSRPKRFAAQRASDAAEAERRHGESRPVGFIGPDGHCRQGNECMPRETASGPLRRTSAFSRNGAPLRFGEVAPAVSKAPTPHVNSRYERRCLSVDRGRPEKRRFMTQMQQKFPEAAIVKQRPRDTKRHRQHKKRYS